MFNDKKLLTMFILIIILPLILFDVVRADIIFQDKFDRQNAWGDWWTDNGVWDAGIPTSGPNGCYSGNKCAATVLDGDYPPGTASRFISRSVQLPRAIGGEEIHLRFWNWFSYSNNGGQLDDSGSVQVSVYDRNTESWSNWETLGDDILNTSPWSRAGRDLTSYSGKKIRIAFLHTARPWSRESSGWYIDNVVITANVPVCPQAIFESSTGIFRIPCALLDGKPEQEYDVELKPPYNVLSVIPK